MSSVWAEEHDSPMVFYTAKLSWSKVVLTTDCLWVGVSALDKWYEGLDKAIENVYRTDPEIFDSSTTSAMDLIMLMLFDNEHVLD